MREADKLICDIIQNELDLDSSRVLLKNQNWTPPKDLGLYVAVSLRRSQVISNSNRFDSDTNEEVKRTVSYNYIDIDITSKNRDAVERKEEVVMSLTSFFSQRLQEDNNVRIFRVSNLLDLSFIEAASALNRFRVSCVLSQVKEIRKEISYYDKFYKPIQEVEQ